MVAEAPSSATLRAGGRDGSSCIELSFSTCSIPFQDRVLHILDDLDTEFYLTGGTAASRGYLGHRFSDDLDLFVNDAAEFSLCSERSTGLCTATVEDWKLVRWIEEPEAERFVSDLCRLGEELLLVR